MPDSASSPDRFLPFAFCWADILLEVVDGHITFAAGAVKPVLGREAGSLVGSLLLDLVTPADQPLADTYLNLIRHHGRGDEIAIRLQGIDGMRPRVSISGHCLAAADHRLFLGLRTRFRSLRETTRDYGRDRQSGLYDGASFPDLAAVRLKSVTAGDATRLTLVSIPALERLCAELPEDESSSLMCSIGTVLKANSVDGDTAAMVTPGKYGVVSGGVESPALLQQELREVVAGVRPHDAPVTVDMADVGIGDLGTISESDLAKGILYTLQKFEDTPAGAVNLRDLASGMTFLVDRTRERIADFRKLVAERKFSVAFQPIIDIRSGVIHHFEALCRFNPTDTTESPYQAINFAEETGMIHLFDLAMVHKVIEWMGRRPMNNDVFRVAVNVSGFSIGKTDYVDGLFALLAAQPWTTGRLMFEITESSRMTDLAAANTFIQRLRGSGYEVCLDDFGAGAASFQYLSTLAVDVVKLDGSAVRNAQKAEKGRAFLSALTELCRRLDVDTVAEMIDTPESLDFVRQCGCNYVQGYLFGKPSLTIRDFMPYPNAGLLRLR